MADILTPCCPGCGEPPAWLLDSGHQAFCFTDECPVLTWDTLASPEENMDGMTWHRLGEGEVAADE